MSVIVEFYSEEIPNEVKTQEAGHVVFDQVEMVRKIIGGSSAAVSEDRAHDGDRAKWPAEYEAFKTGKEAPIEGLPLTEWPQITKDQIAKLATLGVRSIEEFLEAPDPLLDRFGPGSRTLKLKAEAYLEASTGPGKMAEDITALRKDNENLQARVDDLTDQINSLASAQDKATPAGSAPKRKAKPK